jgi:MFS family permease
MTLGMVVIGSGFILTGFVRSIPLLALTVVIWTFGEMLYFPMASAHVANVSPPDMRGRYHGAWGIAWGLGAVLGPVGGTALFAVDARMVWVACALVAAIGAALVLRATRGVEQTLPVAPGA